MMAFDPGLAETISDAEQALAKGEVDDLRELVSPEYPCPECGYEGPHSYLGQDEDSGPDIYECGDPECYLEFSVPRDEVRP